MAVLIEHRLLDNILHPNSSFYAALEASQRPEVLLLLREQLAQLALLNTTSSLGTGW